MEIAKQIYGIIKTSNSVAHEILEPQMRDLVETLGLKPNQVFGLLRVAVTGLTVSPPLFESMEIIGLEKVLERLENAIKLLEKDFE